VTLFWIGIGLIVIWLILNALIPDIGKISICSQENSTTVWLYRGEELINTYLFNYGNILTITLKPGEYKCQYKAGSGNEGVVEVDLKKGEYLKVQIPPV